MVRLWRDCEVPYLDDKPPESRGAKRTPPRLPDDDPIKLAIAMDLATKAERRTT